jgi:DNA-binding response OmpR family regulator
MKAIEQVVGDDMVLRKPFQLAELAASVDLALQGAQRNRNESRWLCAPE